ncbi:MAG: phosphoribosylanthranilate isomerase [Candidatus Marinimicrobia bacterium]|nr:phosphoribosylanthranilate isomerase [Candidatus Neomarinimicrobiota bacterium]
MIPVKICGITRLEDAEKAASLGAAAIGFIFYRKSPRYIQPEEAAAISQSVSSKVKKVGVFVNAAQKEVNRIAEIAGLDFVQLHGEESPEYIKSIEPPVIKAFRVKQNFDSAQLEKYHVHAMLFDAFTKGEYGGTGQSFDWQNVIIERNDTPVILAGGLTPENVCEAIEQFQPEALDVSSGVETEPGVKDHTRLQALFNAIQNTIEKENPFL